LERFSWSKTVFTVTKYFQLHLNFCYLEGREWRPVDRKVIVREPGGMWQVYLYNTLLTSVINSITSIGLET